MSGAGSGRGRDDADSLSFRSPAWSTTGLPCPPLALLVLDDYHLVRAQAVQDAVAFLLEHLPPALHLVIASREDPTLPLPRLRARRQLVEVRAADLGFSVEEAATFLGAGMGLRLEREQLAALVESLTERELEVLRLLAARRFNAGIAAELFVGRARSRPTSSTCTASWASTAAPRRWPARLGCWADIGRGFHPASPSSGGRAPPATPPS